MNKCINFFLAQRTVLGMLFKSLSKMTDLVIAEAQSQGLSAVPNGIVRKRPWCSDWHIKGNWKIEALRHKAIELDQLREIVRLQQFWVMNIELRDQAAKRGDAIAFAYTHDGNVEAVCTTFQRRDSISDGTSGIIVPVELNTNLWIAFSAETDKLLNLTGCGNTNGIRQTNALHSCIDDGIKDGQQV